MIKFFRKIRQSLIKDNKFSKYTIYAIGEIILVVFGILIAVQINSQYEQAKIHKREAILIDEIHQEFLANKEQLEEVVSYHNRALRACNKIIALFPIDLSETNLDSLSTYIYETTWRYTFNPSQGTIRSVIHTSSFEILSDSRLKKLVVSWQDVVDDYKEEEVTAYHICINYLEPYFGKHFPFNGDLRNPKSDLDALFSLEFENLIERRREALIDVVSNNGELNNIQNTIEEIINLTSGKPNKLD